MTKDKALDLALDALESVLANHKGAPVLPWIEARDAIKQARSAPPVCNPHPKAPHGFNRTASHSADRYVCDCEGWDAYEAGYQAGIEDTYKRMDALDTPYAAQQDIQRLSALVRAQQITMDKLEQALAAPEQEPMPDDLIATYEKGFRDGQAAQRSWVGLTEKEIAYVATSHPLTWANLNAVENRTLFARILEAKLRERNT